MVPAIHRLGSASRSSRTAPLLTTARLYLSTSTRSSSRLPSRLGPLLPASATGSSTRATWLPELPLTTHMRSELRAHSRELRLRMSEKEG